MCYQKTIFFTSNILLQISLYILIEFTIKNTCFSLPADNVNANILQTKTIRSALNENLLDDENLFGTYSPLEVNNYNSANEIENSYNGDAYVKENENLNDPSENLDESFITNDPKNEEKDSTYFNPQLKNKYDGYNLPILFDPTEIPQKTVEKLTQFKTMKLLENDKSLLNFCILSKSHVGNVCLLIQSNNKNNSYYNPFLYHRCIKLLSLLNFYHCMKQKQSNDNKHDNIFIDNDNHDPAMKENKTTDIFKRLPFHSWGGKRFRQVATEKIQSSKVPFNAWGGKRHIEQMDFDVDEFCKRSKSKFHSWGGKRNKEY